MKSQPYQAVNEWNTCNEEPQATPQRVHDRTIAIAAAAGRNSLEITQRDYETAKSEVTGESDPERQLQILYPGFKMYTR